MDISMDIFMDIYVHGKPGQITFWTLMTDYLKVFCTQINYYWIIKMYCSRKKFFPKTVDLTLSQSKSVT